MAIIITSECDPLDFFTAPHTVTFTEGERPPVIDVDGVFHLEIDWDTQDVPVAKGYLVRRSLTRGVLVLDAKIVADRWSNTPKGLKLWFHFDFT
jgi:hypothetical protein